MVMLAVPGPEIRSVGRVTCNCRLLCTFVASLVLLMITTEDETKSLPLTVRRKPCCTWATVTVLAESEPMTGAGRELPHNGLSALQPESASKESTRSHEGHDTENARFLGRDSGSRTARAFANAD